MNVDALKTIPEIITAASGTVLGIVALLIVVLAFFGYFFFKDEKAVRYRLAVFLLMFAGTASFSLAALLAQRDDARRVQAQLLPQLKLNLAFVGVDAANPYRAKVQVFVQPNNHPEGAYDAPQYLRTDIQSVPGPGGAVLELRRLAVGDRVYVEVEDQDKKWRSYPMTMLEANLQMNPVEP